MKFIQILSLAALLLGVNATPVGNADVSITGLPASLLREDIPAGTLVFGLDGAPEPNDTDTSSVALGKRDDCNGSSYCWSTSGGACTAASYAYNDNAYYCGYTSRVSGNCAAIFTCWDYSYCWAGWFLKEKFREVYTIVGCGICGSRYFDNGNCRTTYNYCSSCNSIG